MKSGPKHGSWLLNDALFVMWHQRKLPGVLDSNYTQKKENSGYSGQEAQLKLEQSYEGREQPGG